MLYVIYAEGIAQSLPKGLVNHSEHLTRLEQLKQQNRLLVAGPTPVMDNMTSNNAVFNGSVIIAEFVDQKQANEWANSDPYVKAGVYTNVVVKPFNRIF